MASLRVQVLDSYTKAPISTARTVVTIKQPDFEQSAMSDVGVVVFENIQPGFYEIYAHSPDLFYVPYSGSVEVSEDTEINVVLERPLRIVVRDQNDNPVSGANVYLVERIYFIDGEGNQKMAMVLRQFVTDNEGVVAELISSRSVEADIIVVAEGIGQASEIVNVNYERVHEVVLRLAAPSPAAAEAVSESSAESSDGAANVIESSGSEPRNGSEESSAA